MLSLRTIAPHTLELLKTIMLQPELANARLVGGTALALQYGHRSSVDLDFFGNIDTDVDFIDVLSRCGRVVMPRRPKNVQSMIVDDVKMDIVNYSRYQWIDDAVHEDGLRLASPKDIAAMKVNAIEGRGSRKDFIDIYVLLQHYSLDQILDFYAQKYPEHSRFRALMSLMYFTDAENQPMPPMFIPTPWEEMKQAISKAVEALS